MNRISQIGGKSNWNWVTFSVGGIILVGIVLLIVLLGRKNNVSESFQDLSDEEFNQVEEEVPEVVPSRPSPEPKMRDLGRLAPQASEPIGTNEIFKPVDNGDNNDPTGLNGNQLPKDCYPKDQLTPSELLPGDANSKWAEVNPVGQGDLKDQNFLNAGHHLGVNTVGQTLRNSNLQLRSEPPNPQHKVSPWMQTTIEPDTNRRPMEIGGCE